MATRITPGPMTFRSGGASGRSLIGTGGSTLLGMSEETRSSGWTVVATSSSSAWGRATPARVPQTSGGGSTPRSLLRVAQRVGQRGLQRHARVLALAPRALLGIARDQHLVEALGRRRAAQVLEQPAQRLLEAGAAHRALGVEGEVEVPELLGAIVGLEERRDPGADPGAAEHPGEHLDHQAQAVALVAAQRGHGVNRVRIGGGLPGLVHGPARGDAGGPRHARPRRGWRPPGWWPCRSRAGRPRRGRRRRSGWYRARARALRTAPRRARRWWCRRPPGHGGPPASRKRRRRRSGRCASPRPNPGRGARPGSLTARRRTRRPPGPGRRRRPPRRPILPRTRSAGGAAG